MPVKLRKHQKRCYGDPRSGYNFKWKFAPNQSTWAIDTLCSIIATEQQRDQTLQTIKITYQKRQTLYLTNHNQITHMTQTFNDNRSQSKIIIFSRYRYHCFSNLIQRRRTFKQFLAHVTMPPAKPSPVWKYFTRSADKKSATCNICTHVFKISQMLYYTNCVEFDLTPI